MPRKVWSALPLDVQHVFPIIEYKKIKQASKTFNKRNTSNKQMTVRKQDEKCIVVIHSTIIGSEREKRIHQIKESLQVFNITKKMLEKEIKTLETELFKLKSVR